VSFSPNKEYVLTSNVAAGDLVDVPTGLKVGIWDSVIFFTSYFDPKTEKILASISSGATGLEANRVSLFHLEFGPNLDDSISFISGGANELLPNGKFGRMTDHDHAATGGTGAFLGASGNMHAQDSNIFDQDPKDPEGILKIWVPKLPTIL
jgi:hypothetical protein